MRHINLRFTAVRPTYLFTCLLPMCCCYSSEDSHEWERVRCCQGVSRIYHRTTWRNHHQGGKYYNFVFFP